MVMDHSGSEKGKLLLPLHRLGYSFQLAVKEYFICPTPQTTAFVIPVVEHWLEKEMDPL